MSIAEGISQLGPKRLRSAPWLVACAVLLFAAPPALALELEQGDPQFIDGEYRFTMTAVLDAPLDAVERTLRDYENYPALDSRILEAKVLERPEEGVVILATKLRACFGPVCRSVKRVERVEESPGVLVAITDPERSDMKFGETRTELSHADHGRTRVTYQTRLTPGFWVPALLARRLMLATLEDATIELFRSVEARAQHE